ncbi:MAG: hypothetical protein HYT08_04415 [Candidatus Levybacteria bacterium]|nr:hypothetical protein [Candidatus Levybacteria bacterium]
MDQIKKFIRKFKVGKHHLDWVAGLLSIPVLLTVIILNLNNLNSQKKNSNNSSENKPTEKVIVVPETKDKQQTLPTTTTLACKKEIGPISITSPKEGEAVKNNPVCININYDSQNYCSVVWSYRINEGNWSEFSSSSPCIYNAPNGDIKFELRVQSTASQDQQKTIIRNFKYEGTPVASPSAAANY